MFSHTKGFQYNAKPDAPDPVYAKQPQELIGGQWGGMSVTIGYLFQGWNCRGPAKYPPSAGAGVTPRPRQAWSARNS